MRKRADVVLSAQQNISREKAQLFIMAGRVFLREMRIEKPSVKVEETEKLTLKYDDKAFASRGGYKLDKAMDFFNVNVEGLTCLDIGAATGGFTDVLLRRGAGHVYSIDVGYGQIAWELRQDKRVTVMERTNARHLTYSDFSMKPSFAVMDVSFISILKILPAITRILSGGGRIVTLIKPQFEAGRENIGKNGVVRDAKAHCDVIAKIRDSLPKGWHMQNLCFSPITGPKGNIEFLADISEKECFLPDETIKAVVAKAHETLKTKNELKKNTI
ncbi:MAG: TlyA family RNA methyltransferase [Christensenellales bacterium]|jgi:23S rRNA (cytidine1920-2'-O)/16S rRNA (cytidine1409-2'-O)-methyltransferase